MFNQKRRDSDRVDVVNYIGEKVANDIEQGKLAPYVGQLFDRQIDLIDAMYEKARKYGIASLVTAITSVVSVPVSMFFVKDPEDMKKVLVLALGALTISGLLYVLRRWAKQDARILESDILKEFALCDYIHEEEMPEDIYKKFNDESIYEYRENELR